MSSSLFNLWQSLLEKILEPFPSAALVTADGELLVSKYQSLADIGTLPAAALTCHQYFQLKTDDVIVINDPYSGGTVLSSVNLVTGVHFDGSTTKSSPCEALLVVRIPFKPRVILAHTVENEGVRIPPTPLVSGGVLNEQVLEAICAHPMAPPMLRAGLERGLAWLQTAVDEIGRLKALTGSSLNKRMAKDWLQTAQASFQHLLHDLSQGSAKAEVALSPKSKLALAIEIKDQRISFNFTGSGAPDRYALSDAATLGACVGALAAALNVDVPINAGILRSVDVIAPLGSVVHARYPAPVFMGFTDGTSVVAGLVLRLLGQIDKKMAMAQNGMGLCSFELDFGDGRYFYDDLEPGTAATRDRRGADALDLWRRSHLQRSVEACERMYPMRIRSVALRSQSGGSGLQGGGDGQTKVIEVLAPARLRWNLSRGVLRPEGVQGGKAAIGPDILCQRLNKESEALPDSGELQLEAGDQVILHSAGGGGFGEEKEK
ncbi:MAG: hydantoinase B/oxoprolinase family protein [Bdellovibrionales bacterium]